MEEVRKQGVESLFCPYEQALALKELEFDEPCFGKFYHNHLEIGGSWLNSEFNKDKTDGNIFTSAPTFSQAFRWFRDNIYLIGFIEHELIDDSESGYTWNIKQYVSEGVEDTRKKDEWDFWKKYDSFNQKQLWWKTYEEAELECLKKLIEIVKNKHH